MRKQNSVLKKFWKVKAILIKQDYCQYQPRKSTFTFFVVVNFLCVFEVTERDGQSGNLLIAYTLPKKDQAWYFAP